MVRGQIICITEDNGKKNYYRSYEFNGDMCIEPGSRGQEVVDAIHSGLIKSLDEYNDFIKHFDLEHFQYTGVKENQDPEYIAYDIVNPASMAEDYDFFWYDSKTNLYDLTTYRLSDYMYFINLTSNDLEIMTCSGVVIIPSMEGCVFKFDDFCPTELSGHLLDRNQVSKEFPEKHKLYSLLREFDDEKLTLKEAEEMIDAEDSNSSGWTCVFDSVKAFGRAEAESIGIENWMEAYFDFQTFGEDVIRDRDKAIELSSGRVAAR